MRRAWGMRHGAGGEEKKKRALNNRAGDRVCARAGAPRGAEECVSRWWGWDRKSAKNHGARWARASLCARWRSVYPGWGRLGRVRGRSADSRVRGRGRRRRLVRHRQDGHRRSPNGVRGGLTFTVRFAQAGGGPPACGTSLCESQLMPPAFIATVFEVSFPEGTCIAEFIDGQ